MKKTVADLYLKEAPRFFVVSIFLEYGSAAALPYSYLSPIIKQIWILSFEQCHYRFGISYTQHFTTWADTSLHLLLLKSFVVLVLTSVVFDPYSLACFIS